MAATVRFPTCPLSIEPTTTSTTITINSMTYLLGSLSKEYNTFPAKLMTIVAMHALLVCKIFGLKIRSCKIFDKSQV